MNELCSKEHSGNTNFFSGSDSLYRSYDNMV